MINKLNVHVITIHKECFPGTLGFGVIGKALASNKWSLNLINLHDFATDKHRSVDDTTFGGGAGMVIRPDVMGKAIDHAIEMCNSQDYKIIFPSPRGKTFIQQDAEELSLEKNLIFICGRFEGIDERILEVYKIHTISLGDFILSGGEVATQAILEAVIRLHKDVLGNEESLTSESFCNNLLEYPHYTKPKIWKNIEVPEILFSGHHKKIHDWRIQKSIEITKKSRPDLWKKFQQEQ